jgi:hypothetical protein
MQLFGIIALFVGVAVAAPTILTERDAPSGHEVQISGFTYNGAGCPRNTVSSVLSDDLTTMTLIYGDAFTAQAGKGIEPKERLKNCQVNVKLHFPQGWQFSVFKADYRGHATLPRGASGSCKATYYFSGDSHQVRLTRSMGEIRSSKRQTGLEDRDFSGPVRRQLPQNRYIRRREHCLVALRRCGHAQYQL